LRASRGSIDSLGQLKYRRISQSWVSKECRDEKSSEGWGYRLHNFGFVRDHELATIIQRPPEALTILLLDSFVESVRASCTTFEDEVLRAGGRKVVRRKEEEEGGEVRVRMRVR
jgi:hypothetical protein